MKGTLVAIDFVAFSLVAALSAPATASGDIRACPEQAPPACTSASGALAEAEAAVRAAAAKHALWTTAEEALEAARSACANGEYADAANAARRAAEQARLGIAQTQYPTFPLPKP